MIIILFFSINEKKKNKLNLYIILFNINYNNNI